jgi:hypothetical protein
MPKAENKRERIPLLVAVKSIEALAAFLRFDRQGRYRPRGRHTMPRSVPTADPEGNMWTNNQSNNNLLMFDPKTERFVEFLGPASSNFFGFCAAPFEAGCDGQRVPPCVTATARHRI